jgi:predicted nuclease of restriction endonuclease-like RecB superfamily
MLTAELVKPLLQQRGMELYVNMLDSSNTYWQQTANDLIILFQQQIGHTFYEWETALEKYEGDRTDYVVVRGLAKVISGEATFTPRETPLPPPQLRECLFRQGPRFSEPHLFEAKTRQDILLEVASQLETTADILEEALYADRPANYILHAAGKQWTADELIARYNLELARGVLYWASQITIDAASSYKDLWRYIKYFKLMFWAEPKDEGGYRIKLDGPISPFVNATIRYGRQMAVFLPALLLCEQWQLQATIHLPQVRLPLTYNLDYTSSLRSHFKRSGVFDSRLEADFAEEFEQKIGSKRGHWQLRRESEILLLGNTVMIPDFTFVDEQDDSRKILLELVGFWHPDYLRRKVEKVRLANCSHLLLLVYQGLNVTEDSFRDVASEVIFFQKKPVVKEVITTVDAMAERLYGPRMKSKKKKRT